MEVHDTKRKRSGQILIFGAIIIMLLVFSTAIAIHTSSTTYQSLRYSEVKEFVGNFNEDFQRALRNILANATQEYNQTTLIIPTTTHALDNSAFWIMTAIRTFAPKGAQMNFTIGQTSLQLNWFYLLKGNSSMSANCTVDVPSLGFYGWKENVVILLNMEFSIFNETDKQETLTGINVIVNKEGSQPVDDLKLDNFRIQYFDLSTKMWRDCINRTLYSNGGGNYTIYLGVLGSSSNFLKIWVKDTRGIIVECFNSSPIIETQLSATNMNLTDKFVNDTAYVIFPGFLIPSAYPIPTGYINFSVQLLDGSWTQLGTFVPVNWNNNTKQLWATSPDFYPSKAGTYYFNATYSGNSIYSSCTSNITQEKLVVK